MALRQDYLVRLIVAMSAAIRRALSKKEAHEPYVALDDLERAIGEAVDMDGAILLTLAPESLVSILQLGSVNDSLAEYIVRAILLQSELYSELGEEQLAEVRNAQAEAIASAFECGDPYDLDLEPFRESASS